MSSSRSFQRWLLEAVRREPSQAQPALPAEVEQCFHLGGGAHARRVAEHDRVRRYRVGDLLVGELAAVVADVAARLTDQDRVSEQLSRTPLIDVATLIAAQRARAARPTKTGEMAPPWLNRCSVGSGGHLTGLVQAGGHVAPRMGALDRPCRGPGTGDSGEKGVHGWNVGQVGLDAGDLPVAQAADGGQVLIQYRLVALSGVAQ